MPKVGCFWPGLFKSSNCLFSWAARETGKCSFLPYKSHFSVGVGAGGDHGIPPPRGGWHRSYGGLCRLALQAPRLGITRGLPPKGLPWVSSPFVCSATSRPLPGHPRCHLPLPGSDSFQTSLGASSLPFQRAPLRRLPSLTSFLDPRRSSTCLLIRRDTANEFPSPCPQH